MLKKAILLVALFSVFSSTSFAVAATNDELVKKFSEAESFTTQGQISQAISIYQSLIDSNPQLPEAYNNLAALYLKQKKTKQAKDILEQGLHAHKGYGVLYESLTAINVAMAREAYSKALQIDLKPSDITIASLSYNEHHQVRQNKTIVISKVDKPELMSKIQTEPEEKIVVKTEPASKVQPVGKIQRVEVVAQTKPVVERKVKNPETIETIIQAWAAAWSAQAADMYLSFYHEQYKPSNGVSREGWAQSRRYRLTKPHWIKIALSDFNVESNTGKQAVVSFKQLYQSNGFSDANTKQMVLLYTDNGWRIFRETSL